MLGRPAVILVYCSSFYQYSTKVSIMKLSTNVIFQLGTILIATCISTDEVTSNVVLTDMNNVGFLNRMGRVA